jgi:hypothetical protein
MYFLMAFLADWNLFAIEFAKDVVESGRFSFMRELADMSDVMHYDLSFVLGLTTYTAGFTQLGACSHAD